MHGTTSVSVCRSSRSRSLSVASCWYQQICLRLFPSAVTPSYTCHAALAALLHCKPEEVALLSGAAEGWRAALHCLNLTKGDRILLSAAKRKGVPRLLKHAASVGSTVHMARARLQGAPATQNQDLRIAANTGRVFPAHGYQGFSWGFQGSNGAKRPSLPPR